MTIKKQWDKMELLNDDGVIVIGYNKLSMTIYYEHNFKKYLEDIEDFLELASKRILPASVTTKELLETIGNKDSRLFGMDIIKV